VQAPDSISARIVLSDTTWQWQTIIGRSCPPAPAQKHRYASAGKHALQRLGVASATLGTVVAMPRKAARLQPE
jgi:hypothetical protein